MKVIDKTPFQDEKGNMSLYQRIQSTLEYGAEWQAEIEAQKGIIAQLERVLEKGFTLIRNLNLENSKIIEPLILVGPPGVYVLYVTPVTGFFEAKGDEWNVIKGHQHTPAPVNLMSRVGRLARAVQVFLNRQGVFLPGVVEPVLIAADPGVHVESLRPVVRVVLSDGVKQFAASLLQGRPLLKSEAVFEVVDHLINPRRKGAAAAAGASPFQGSEKPAPMYDPNLGEVVEEVPGASTEGSPPASQRARAIFHAAEESKPFDPADLSFEFDEHGTAAMPDGLLETSPSQRPEGAAPRRGFSQGQWIFLVVMALIEFLVLAGFVYMLLFAGA
ncbi:MAG TPA: hypothetical protein VIU38_02580 [Anaerolineales bacterium]